MYSEITYDNIREIGFSYCSEPFDSFELRIVDGSDNKAVLVFTPEAYQELQNLIADAITKYNCKPIQNS